MKNSLTELNSHLFAQLDRLGDKKLDKEGLEKEVARAKSIVDVSGKIIDTAGITLKAAELVATHGVGGWENMLPEMEGKPKPPGVKSKPPALDYGKETGA